MSDVEIQLHVKPLDGKSKGSYRRIRRFQRTLVQARRAVDENDADTLDTCYAELEGVIAQQAEVSGGNLEEALDALSMDEFFALVQALLGEAAPPPENAVDSAGG